MIVGKNITHRNMSFSGFHTEAGLTKENGTKKKYWKGNAFSYQTILRVVMNPSIYASIMT